MPKQCDYKFVAHVNGLLVKMYILYINTQYSCFNKVKGVSHLKSCAHHHLYYEKLPGCLMVELDPAMFI